MEKVHSYWKRPDDGINQPERYRDVSPDRSIYLVDLFKRLSIRPAMRILEVGPNVGRNLAHLWDAGYRSLGGIEISGDAVDLMRRTYPQLSGVKVIVQPVENVAKLLPTRGYDVTFTMAVLQHIHPESDWVFPHLARASNMIVTVEDEVEEGPHHFPRDYRRVFETCGMKELLHENCRRINGLGGHFTARALRHG
jgi:SAM-dependent methyltransferase